ncbi:unnamed protein product [Symbiodinium sp. CCMP2456]|nr:unnamed protein product [Symbiodinium sp. CCMP2456]
MVTTLPCLTSSIRLRWQPAAQRETALQHSSTYCFAPPVRRARCPAMAGRRASLLSAFAAGAVLHLLMSNTVFVQPGPGPEKCWYSTGKVNLGVDGSVVKSKNMPAPVLEATEATNTAIKECLDEGCSIDALMELDKKLAKDEATIKKSLDNLHSSQAEEYSEEGKEQIAWLSNYLDRSGSLRAQLQAVKTLKAEGDLVAQLVRAASVAFGGGRKGDYPKAQICNVRVHRA